MVWKWILKAAIALAQSEWARQRARLVIAKLRADVEAHVKVLADTAGIAVPNHDPSLFRAGGTLIRTKRDIFKPGQPVFVEGHTYKITKLLSASAVEVTYEAEPI